MKSFLQTICTLLFSLLFASYAYATTYPLPTKGESIVGEIQRTTSRAGETLGEVGRRFDIGYYEMVESNPNVNPHIILPPSTSIIVPSRFILPPKPWRGIIINLAELRLYYFPKGENVVVTMPVGIGKQGWQTPLGQTKIIQKKVDPAWRPTQSVREDAARLGQPLPLVVPPGPDNPLGQFAMRLGWRTYLIHGTNRPEGVGRRSSAGCIRMYPEDIESLFAATPINTPVRVINLAFKVGWHRQLLFLEAHKPLQEQSLSVALIRMVDSVYHATKNHPAIINWREAKAVTELQNGIPAIIGNSWRTINQQTSEQQKFSNQPPRLVTKHHRDLQPWRD